MFLLASLPSLQDRLTNFEPPSNLDSINHSSYPSLLCQISNRIDNILRSAVNGLTNGVTTTSPHQYPTNSISMPSLYNSSSIAESVRELRSRRTSQTERNRFVLDMVEHIQQLAQSKLPSKLSFSEQSILIDHRPSIRTATRSSLSTIKLRKEWKAEVDTLRLQQKYRLEGRIDELTIHHESHLKESEPIKIIRKLLPSHEVLEAASTFLSHWKNRGLEESRVD